MTQLASDNFVRADSAGLGANWTTQSDGNSFDVSGNKAVPHSLDSDCGDIYTGAAFPNDQYSEITIGALTSSTGGTGPGVMVRASTSQLTRYRCVVCNPGSGGTTIELAKEVNGAYTPLGTAGTAVVVGDRLRLEVHGTAISVFVNDVNTNIGGSSSVTDASISSGGAGIIYSSTASSASITNWIGGDFNAGGGAVKRNNLGLLGVGR